VRTFRSVRFEIDRRVFRYLSFVSSVFSVVKDVSNLSSLLHLGFLQSAENMTDRPALEVGADVLTYGDLVKRAASLAATIQQETPKGGSRTTAVFADRSITAFSGILGSLFAGRAYVPLNPHFPSARTTAMLQQADSRSLIVDAGAAQQLDGILDGIDIELLVILPDQQDVTRLAERWPRHTFVAAGDLERPSMWTLQPQSVDDGAYLLFTSGTTGVPKGVMVTHDNISHFVQTMVDRYGITSDDRFSQTFDTTFDLSVFDMFVAWDRGACVCCPSRKTLLNPDKFIREKALTVWFSVPSVGLLMDRFGVLKPGRYPSLRWSLFCGERLPVELTTRWAAAAPNSDLENLYGPTELTVACSAYRWSREQSASESALGIVPIGFPLPGMEARVVNEDDLSDVAPGMVGELLMAGPQLTPGYWNDRAATERAYVRLPGSEAVFYRTGDRVRQPVDGGPLTFLGRVDQQIKVRGHRVELAEVESTLREAPGVESAVAVGWPTTATGPAGIAAFVTGTGVDIPTVRGVAQSKLQTYAVPQTIRVLADFPQNPNGKVDRQALVKLLDA
jgi:amino acid adenylation domain-containing protein